MWYETAKRPPTEKDGVGNLLDVLCESSHLGLSGYVYRAIPWHMVAEHPETYRFWQPITPPEPPKPPEEKAYDQWLKSKSNKGLYDAFIAGVQWQKEQNG